VAVVDLGFTNSGKLTLESGKSLAFTKDVIQLAGEVILNGSAKLDLTGKKLDLQGGVLRGSGEILVGELINKATISVGSDNTVGELKITGSYTQDKTGTLKIETKGKAPTDYDRLLVSGTAKLAGNLIISLIGAPELGKDDKLTFLSYGMLDPALKAFDTITEGWDIAYGASSSTISKK
jgi:hypothetical protein